MESKLLLEILKSDPFVKRLHPRILTNDGMPSKLKNDKVYIIHLSSRDTPPKNGFVFGHFVFLDTIKKNGRSSLCYFDSYGRSPNREIKKTINNYISQNDATFEFNAIRYQNDDDIICGEITIYIALLRARGNCVKKCQKLLRIVLPCISRLISQLPPLRAFDKKKLNDFKKHFATSLMESYNDPLQYSLISPNAATTPPNSPVLPVLSPFSLPNSEFELFDSSPKAKNAKKANKRGASRAIIGATSKSAGSQTRLTGGQIAECQQISKEKKEKEKAKKRKEAFPKKNPRTTKGRNGRAYKPAELIDGSDKQPKASVNDAKNREYKRASQFIVTEFSRFLLTKLVMHR